MYRVISKKKKLVLANIHFSPVVCRMTSILGVPGMLAVQLPIISRDLDTPCASAKFDPGPAASFFRSSERRFTFAFKRLASSFQNSHDILCSFV